MFSILQTLKKNQSRVEDDDDYDDDALGEKNRRGDVPLTQFCFVLFCFEPFFFKCHD